MKLDLYKKKRDFKKTKEPKPKVSHQYKNLFVIQKHAASHLHYDFRLELNGVLLSWAIPKGPCLDPSVKRLAVHVEDHPVAYGHFEGIIPKGEYGGGTVMLWDQGTWQSDDANPNEAYKKGHMRFHLNAKKLKGAYSLIRFGKKDEKSWFLIKAKDKYAKPLEKYDITSKKTKSVLSNHDITKIAKEANDTWSKDNNKKIWFNLPDSKMPVLIKPQLATLVDNPPDNDDWIHELKLDGYRILAYKINNDVVLKSRNNKDWTHHFPNVVTAIKKIPYKNFIIDGEIVVLDKEGHSNFQLLQNAIKDNVKKQFLYYLFDILYFNKKNVMSLPLLKRKSILKEMLLKINHSSLFYTDHIKGRGKDIFANACQLSLEGIISKNKNSTYEQKRSKNWLKTKCHQRQEFLVGGYLPPKNSRKYFGALMLGYYNDRKEFIYSGNVGTGFNNNSLKEIHQQLEKNLVAKNPFTTKPPSANRAIWVAPKLIVEVEFTEWTDDGMLRHPSFKGVRSDKSPKKISREKKTSIKKVVEKKSSDISLTHPDKILYAEGKITKQDLSDYYEAIKDWILPYITKRPLTLVRCPENYKKCFFQKHITDSSHPHLYDIKIKEKESTEKCIYIKDISGLLTLVQMGTLEIHAWGAHIDKVEYPDMITIDLDPAPKMPWKKVVAAAKLIRKYLLQFGLESFVKTTGGKGLHVVVPIKPEYKWEQIKNFTKTFVHYIADKYPKDYVDNMSKKKRQGKIFLDYLRNQRGATSVCAYSTRARKGAPVSMPIAWEELTDRQKDTEYTIKTAVKRLQKLKKDPWQDFFKVKQSLPK